MPGGRRSRAEEGPAGGAREAEALLLPHLGDCLAFAHALTRNRHDAEDLVQDTFLRAQGALGRFRRGTNAKAWLFTILRRLFIDRVRRARLHPLAVDPGDLSTRPAREGDGAAGEPGEGSVDLPGPERIRALLDRVPDPYRTPVLLRDLFGFRYREIAEILAVPDGTVMSRLHRGREYLRELLVPPQARAEGPRDGTDG